MTTKAKKPRKPRIITLTVRRLRALAQRLSMRGDVSSAGVCDQIADNLNAYDARETRLDPRLRRPRKK